MNIIADTHTHTIASTHAFSTVIENAEAASLAGLKYMAITDHAPDMPDAPHLWHFMNLRMLPDEIKGVRILRGIEVDIVNKNGELDVETELLQRLEWVVASFHAPAICDKMDTNDDFTSAYLNLATNPYVDVIGHSGTAEFSYDYEKVIPVFKANNKLVEINENSHIARGNSMDTCLRIANICKSVGAKIIVNSDAHFAYSIGQVQNSLKMLRDIDFPEELVVNSTVERFEAYLASRKRK